MEFHKFNTLKTTALTSRTLFLDKLLRSNTFACPILKQGSIFIELRALETFENPRIVAAMFILRLLAQQRPYVARFGLFQTFREKRYDVLVRVDILNSPLFNFTEFLACKILPFLSRADLFFNALTKKNGFVLELAIMDLSFLRAVETHSVFFKWHDCVKINLAIEQLSVAELPFFLSTLKLDLDFINKSVT